MQLGKKFHVLCGVVSLTYLFLILQSNALSIITGPIIGLVNTTSARILIEFDTAGPMTLILTDPIGSRISTTVIVQASIPVPFIFEGLLPNTKYTVSLEDSSIYMTESYFTTLSGESGKLNFAVISCMDRKQQLAKEPQADLWADMLRRIQNNEISYLLQIGDQVYTDHSLGSQDPEKPYTSCMTILTQTPPDQWGTKRDQLLEIIRDEYRETWNIPTVKETLAKIPSLTIFDDHDIRDDWGFLPQDTDPNSADYYYGSLARQVYYEYQRQLREDIDFNYLDAFTQEYYYLILNGIGYFFLDYRGVRTWDKPYSQIENSQLGATQIQLLEQVLNPNNGTFANLNNFFLLSPLSVVFLPKQFIRIGAKFENDAEESWTFRYGHEQALLLNLLRNWKVAKSGREVTIITGDVHMGGYSDIYFDDDYAFLQFSASSISSSAPSDIEFLGFNAIKEIENLEDPWSYEHHDWTNRFNYGMVITDYIGSLATAQCFLVQASSNESPTIKNVDGEETSSSSDD